MTINYIIIILTIILTILKIIKNKENTKYYIVAALIIILTSYLLIPENKTNITKKKDEKIVSKVESTTSNEKTNKTSKGYEIEYKDGAYYIDNILIANKSYMLSEDWVPSNTIKQIPESGFDHNPLDKEAYQAWIEMKSDAAALNLNIWAQSGYRSYSYQKEIYENYVKTKGQEAADKSSARPGASEHQTGLALDLNTITTSFKDTEEGKWVNNNCYNYGFIIRYPEGKTNETGYIYEPWHIRYVGKELAKKLYNNGSWITLEEYLGIESKYNN